MALCEHDRIYVAALYDRWVYQARKRFYWLERLTKVPGGGPPTLLDMYEKEAYALLERAWELGVHCDVLTDELRFWKAWEQEAMRLAGEEYEDLDKEYRDSDEARTAEAEAEADARAADFFERMTDVHERFTKLGIERSKR